MKLPEINILCADTWKSPLEARESKPRFVTRYELECCIGGNGASSVDERRRELTPGTFVFAKPGQIRHSRFPFETRFIHFELPREEEPDRLLSQISSFPQQGEKQQALMTAICDNFLHRPMLATVLLLELLLLLADGTVGNSVPAARPGQQAVFAAITVMKQNLHRPLQAAEMAAAAGYSVPHFNVRFRELTGSSPYEYFTQMRMNEAKRLLICEGLTVSETAEHLGYATVSHFGATFRRYTGMTPTAFLKNGRINVCETV